ncbi:hypothetical protein KJ611_04100 [Patescibacteria group bacterium]|nr:hypothetical protein [Patescibacteria group bacterium]MBU1705633.1 hypothetical protein [Patescibacteria group bacterium]
MLLDNLSPVPEAETAFYLQVMDVLGWFVIGVFLIVILAYGLYTLFV